MKDKIIEILSSFIEEYIEIKKEDCPEIAAEIEAALIWHGPDEVPPIMNTVVEDENGTRWLCDAVYRWWVEQNGERILMGKNRGPNRWRYPAPLKRK